MRDGDSFSPYRAGAQLGSYPHVPDGAGASFRGQKGQQEPFAAAFVVLPYPSPGRGITASRWRFGMVSRCSAYGATRPAENLGPEGVKSAEAVPRPWLTFNLVQKHREGIKSSQGRLNTQSGAVHIHRPESPLKFQLQGVFALWGRKSNFVIMSLFQGRSAFRSARAPARGVFLLPCSKVFMG